MGETGKTRQRLLDMPGVGKTLLYGDVLDIGCGGEKIVPHAIGLDRRPDREVVDIVYSSHTLEDFENTGTVLQNWWRCVKPGGYLILYLPHADWYPNIGHPLANKAHKHDFRPVDNEVLGGHISPLPKTVHCESYGPPDGKYDYERRGSCEYSFLIIWRKPEVERYQNGKHLSVDVHVDGRPVFESEKE